MRDVERDWLAWARPIVCMAQSAQQHFEDCQARLAKPKQFNDRAQEGYRWPGYLGANWERGRGILFVGSIHGDFRGSVGNPDSRQPFVDRLIGANETWRDLSQPGVKDDERYLNATRSAYTSLMDFWPRAKQFRVLLQRTFVGTSQPYDHAAWTNLAHCRSRGGVVDELALQKQCSGRQASFPIGELIRTIQPAAIICSVISVGTTRAAQFDLEQLTAEPTPQSSYHGPIVRAFHGLHGTWNGKRQADWLDDLAIEIGEQRDR
jgi:hypothetical protein